MLTMLYFPTIPLTIKKRGKNFANMVKYDKKGKNTSQISKEVKINMFILQKQFQNNTSLNFS